MLPTKALVFFSGGTDSWVHLMWAIEKWGKDNVRALFIDFGHRYADKEREVALRLAQGWGVECVVEELRTLGRYEADDAHMPLRNVFMLLLGSYHADNLVFGMLRGESSEDKQPAFIRRMQELLRGQWGQTLYAATARPIKVWTPFARYTKTQMVRWYLARDYSRPHLKATIGCYGTGKFKNCGACMACFNRWVSLTNNGVFDTYPTKYPWDWALQQLRERRQNSSYDGRESSIWQLWMKRRQLWDSYRALRTEFSPGKIWDTVLYAK